MDSSQKYISPTQSEKSRRRIENDQSQYSSQHTDGFTSSVYTVGEPHSSFQTPFTTDLSDAPSSGQSGRTSVHSSHQPPKESIRLMPVKVKDVIEMFKNNPAYRDKSPVMINMKENDIDQIIEKQRYGNGKLSASPNQSLRQSLRGSPMSVRRSDDKSLLMKHSLGQEPSPRSLRHSFNQDVIDPSSRTIPLSDQQPEPSKPPLGADQAQQVYAMTDVQAYPMIGGTGFRANKSRRTKTLRSRSRRKVTPGRRLKRKPRRKQRSKSRHRTRSRGRSRPKKVVRMRSRKRSPVVVVSKRRYPRSDPFYCSPYPLCDNDCTIIQRPLRSLSRPAIGQSRVSMTCECNLCMEKLQFIQPAVCSKKKYMWTNEYAIIPKPQVNLIDPCEELDPAIYPRADNPCIRDGRGNPLTDCIGRPLRNPIGKKFLNFSANGSVMDTNFRGNFYTGQPPVCVKCTLPNSTCAPDTTHNWWMSCGYPVKPDMNPFFQHVVATENQYRR